jgi:uncharacterized peroxidase-related enzyme
VRHHGAGLRQLTRDDRLVETLATDYRQANISAADRAMLDYTVKLTLTPATITQSDIEALRNAGFSEAAILDICQVTAYYAFVNRLADGLGVELEEYWKEEA